MYNIKIEKYLTTNDNRKNIYNVKVSTNFDDNPINAIKSKNSKINLSDIYDINDLSINDIEFSVSSGKFCTINISVNDFNRLIDLEIYINKLVKLFNDSVEIFLQNSALREKYYNEIIETINVSKEI